MKINIDDFHHDGVEQGRGGEREGRPTHYVIGCWKRKWQKVEKLLN